MSDVEAAREWYLRKDRTMTTAEKRSVHTDALETLGTIIESGERDAIHLAVEPVVAGEKLHPGQDICIHNGEARNVGMGKALGIVDPFLRGPVAMGEKFWLVVYPRRITSLRHVWSHPDFAEAAKEHALSPKQFSELWLRQWCSSHDCPDYETMMKAIRGEPISDDGYASAQYRDRWDGEGEELYFNGVDAHEGDVPAEFWAHVETVLGFSVTHAKHFTCSC